MNSAHPAPHVRLTCFFKWLAVVASLAVAGCAPEHGATISSSDVHHGEHDTWTAEEAWYMEEGERIGALDGSGADVFGEIGALAVAGNGGVYVYDRMARQIRRFTSTGQPDWVFGSPGPGPGEFQGVTSMAEAGDGRLWVVDPANRRYTILDRGQLDRTIVREPSGGSMPVGFTPQGTLLDAATAPDAEAPSYRLLEVDHEGRVNREFIFPATRIPLPTLGLGVMVPVPHAPRFLRALDPQGAIWHATTAEYRIARLAFSGDTTVVTVGQAQPSPLNLEEQEAVESGIRTARERFSVDVDDEMIPAAIGPLRWMIVDDQGNLWVCATGRDPCDRLDVINAEGRLLGTVDLPASVTGDPRPVIQGGTFVGVTTGPDGQPQVLRATIRRPSLNQSEGS